MSTYLSFHCCLIHVHCTFTTSSTRYVISIVLSFSKTANAAAKPLVTEDGSLQLDMQRIMDVASQVQFSTSACAFSLWKAPTRSFKGLLETPKYYKLAFKHLNICPKTFTDMWCCYQTLQIIVS